jgi:hypothetical protein
MTNVNITQAAISFYSDVANCEIDSLLIEPIYEIIDDENLHILCEAGVYFFSLKTTTFNGQSFTNTTEAVALINSL